MDIPDSKQAAELMLDNTPDLLEKTRDSIADAIVEAAKAGKTQVSFQVPAQIVMQIRKDLSELGYATWATLGSTISISWRDKAQDKGLIPSSGGGRPYN